MIFENYPARLSELDNFHIIFYTFIFMMITKYLHTSYD